ncbi:autotransporter outer membrane beta-barrel domain-containing protein [Bradyrhizobium sp. CB2312]|uniref:autotransporter family protein n=1 Tax=Bradyrhizobium sp. CB2312 TaxID=3039155 RepID=UPI0024B12C83|nr:autotransporter outer membrane beta-barrel domain-containing protein [Bradyrhizobium sp. CB2312]WFU69609.1 autotransporter outer membrane beta-barrel domain-containing protein [Bradyrhizobium sp. CB2312]
MVCVVSAVPPFAMVHGSISTAQAANCPVNGSQEVSVSGAAASCTIPPASTVARVTAANSAAIAADGVSINVPFGTAVTAQSGATITFGIAPAPAGGSSIANPTGGGGIIGLLASGAQSHILASGLNVILSGGGNTLVKAENGGVITLDNNTLLNILNSGGNTGLLATGAGSQIIADSITVQGPLGGGDFAAHTLLGAQIDLSNSTINITGTSGGKTPVEAETGSTITANRVIISVSGTGGDAAVKALSASTISLTGGSITVTGLNAGGETGVLAQSFGSTITATNVPISVTGTGGDVGVSADSGGHVKLTRSDVSVVGTGGESGLRATGSASIETTGGWVSVVNGAGGLLQNGGNVTMAGTNVTASGNGGFGFLFNNAGAANTLQYSNATIVASDASFSVQGATANIYLSNAIATVNNGQWLNVSGGSTSNVVLKASTVQGVALTDALSASNVTLQNGSLWTMTGSSNVNILTNDPSLILFTSPTGDPTLLASYKTLTVVNYIGAGGAIGLNTFLGTDGSPSDRLVINGGSATGNSFVRITNASGPGAYTSANGILVVEAANSGATAENAFTLAGEARAGFIDYRLYRGGFNGTNPDDWFLRSTFNGGNGNGDSGNGPVTPPGVLPTDPAPDDGQPPPPGVWPIIGPELATYGVVQPVARQMGLSTLGTLHERVGDASADAACLNATPDGGAITKAPPVPYNCRSAVWGRLFGQRIDNHYQAFADPRATGQVAGIQTGIDVWRGSLVPSHSDTVGLYFAYGNGNVSVDGVVTNAAATAYVLQHTGSVNLNAYSFGGYWTHYGPTGWYIDAVLQGSFYNGNAATQFANLPIGGTGFTSSLEAGYPIPLSWFGPRLVLEPEGQIIWQRLSFDDANDGLGPVGLGTTSGASGRLGLRGKWTINDLDGRVWQPYVLANVWRDWGAKAITMYGPDAVPLVERATRLEFAGGLSAKLLPGLSLYAQAGYQFAVSGTDGGRRDGVRGNLGVHYSW